MDLGGGHLSIASVFFGSVDMPAAETIWPKNSTWNWNRWHFLGVTLRPACFNRLRTSCSHVTCSSKVSLKRIMSSRYIRQISQWRPERTSSISRSNGHRDLPISTGKVQSGEPLGPSQSVDSVIDTGQWIGILYCQIVDPSVVHTEPGRSVLLLYQDNRRSPTTTGRFNDPKTCHSGKFFLDNFILR